MLRNEAENVYNLLQISIVEILRSSFASMTTVVKTGRIDNVNQTSGDTLQDSTRPLLSGKIAISQLSTHAWVLSIGASFGGICPSTPTSSD